MAIDIAQNVNSLSSEQVKKDNTNIQIKKQEMKKDREASQVLSEADLKTMIEKLEKGIRQFNRRLKFDINKEINRIVIKVIDRDTDKIIREIPPSEIQNLLMRIREAIGLLYDIEI